MALLTLQNISMAFGGPLLLDGACLQLERNERVCLLGRNGEGKSTLLRIIGGELAPLGGEISRQKELKIGLLRQQYKQVDVGPGIQLGTPITSHCNQCQFGRQFEQTPDLAQMFVDYF